MTDLVAELRRRAADARWYEAFDESIRAEAYEEAAKLVEAEPLYKAAKPATELLAEALPYLDQHPTTTQLPGRVRALLATLPKEAPPGGPSHAIGRA